MKICHLLLTRFNIQYEPNESVGIAPEWLEERLRLFEKYCLPSVVKQTCKDFTWLLFCDSRTPEIYKTKIQHYQSIVPQLRIYWLPYHDNDYREVFVAIGQEYASGYDCLISSRIDNDDSIEPEYIARVREAAEEGEEGIISFPKGTQVFVRQNKSYTVRYIPNHFTSRIEKQGFETILVRNHTEVARDEMVLIETQEPMWKEIVHANNMFNDYTPAFHYYIRNFSDFADLSRRWVWYQLRRIKHLRQLLFVHSNKV